MASSVRDAAHDGDTDRLAAIIDGISATAKRGPKRALGTGDDVPVFLRYDGWVPYCPIPKDAVKAACKRVWALKTGCPNTLADVFHTYMIRKEPDTRKRCEFVYNFVDELERYAPTDVECDLFRRVLFQELSEDIIEEQELMASELERCLRLCASNGIVETDMFIDAIRLFFPDKTDARLADLRELVENDATKNGSVQIDRLLPSDDTHQSPFLDRARCQLVTEVVEFRASIEKALWGCADTEGGRAARLTCEDARKALRQVEPHYTAKEVDDMIARGLGTDNADAIDLQAFLKRLLSSGSLMAPRRLYKKGAAVDETVQEVLHRQQAAEYS
ncbi:Uncharacterized protein PBTT_02613 [Plasmodiophora brassicae]|nr:hypothetical protein PBRA_006588 [Plasmodiophora brassicae]